MCETYAPPLISLKNAFWPTWGRGGGGVYNFSLGSWLKLLQNNPENISFCSANRCYPCKNNSTRRLSFLMLLPLVRPRLQENMLRILLCKVIAWHSLQSNRPKAFLSCKGIFFVIILAATVYVYICVIILSPMVCLQTRIGDLCKWRVFKRGRRFKIVDNCWRTIEADFRR